MQLSKSHYQSQLVLPILHVTADLISIDWSYEHCHHSSRSAHMWQP